MSARALVKRNSLPRDDTLKGIDFDFLKTLNLV